MKIAIIDAYHALHFDVINSLLIDNLPISFTLTGVDANFHGDIGHINQLRKLWPLSLEHEPIERFLFPENVTELVNIPYHLSNDLLESYGSIESTFYKLTDRSSIRPISVHQRSKYYQILLNYFIDVYKRHNITHVICFDTPHSFISYLFHQVLRKNGVKTIRLEYHYFSEYCLVLENEGMPSIPKEYLAQSNLNQIKNEVPDHLLELLNNRSPFVEQYVSKEKKRIVSNGILAPIKVIKKHLVKYIINIVLGIFPFLQPPQVKHFTSLLGKKGSFSYRMIVNRALVRSLRLQLCYNQIAEFPKYNQPYVLFAMHMQPEKTTLPLARRMDNHLTAITILSQSIPQNWKLYVKEHPNQFNVRKVANQNFRDTSFYKTLGKLKNVVLIPLNIPTDILIKHSQLVSTLTGTVGWEALNHRKPVLVFGDAYYRACRATRLIDDVETCKKAINELLKLSSEEIENEIYRYLAYYTDQNILVNAANWESKVEHGNLSRIDQIKLLSETLKGHLN